MKRRYFQTKCDKTPGNQDHHRPTAVDVVIYTIRHAYAVFHKGNLLTGGATRAAGGWRPGAEPERVVQTLSLAIRIAGTESEVRPALRLRHEAFVGETPIPDAVETDAYDDHCIHLIGAAFPRHMQRWQAREGLPSLLCALPFSFSEQGGLAFGLAPERRNGHEQRGFRRRSM